MKLLFTGMVLFLGACDTYKVGALDDKAVIARCTTVAECAIDDYDDNDFYDVEDEAILKQTLIESCVDDHYDNLAIASQLGCKAEYKEYKECMLANMPIECEYDSEEYEDYIEDSEEYSNETCWKAIQQYNECRY